MIRHLTLCLLFCLVFLPGLFAETAHTDFMRNMGKMYVVVAVILAIFFGIVLFLIYLERKISRLEKQIEEHG